MEIDKICCFQYWHNWNFDTTLAKPLDVLNFTKHNDDEGNEKVAADANSLYDLKKNRKKYYRHHTDFFFSEDEGNTRWTKHKYTKPNIDE